MAEDRDKQGNGLRSESVRLFRRREQKYEVGPAIASRLRDEIARHLPLFEFESSQPTTYITTLYFDTHGRDFFRRAERNYDDNVKIRVKEYYYERRPTNGSEADSSPSRGYKTSPICYVELKQSVAGVVIKKRFAFPKRDLHLLLDGRDVWPILLKVTPRDEVGSLREVYREFLRYVSKYAIHITSIVSYRRLVFQEREDDLRITFDDELRVYPPHKDLFDGVEALTPDVLGEPARRSDKVILEIKCPGEYPDWLRKAMQDHAALRLSKFTTSVRLLLPECEAGRHGGDGNGKLRDGAGHDTQTMQGFLH